MTSASESSASVQPVLQMRGISKRYPGARALNNANLEVRAGEVHVVVGENGAGKSTLMKILSGAVRADAGEILLDGSPVELTSPLQARKLGISTIYQELSLVPHLSVAENIFLGKTPTRWAGIVDSRRMRRRGAPHPRRARRRRSIAMRRCAASASRSSRWWRWHARCRTRRGSW